MGSNVPTADLRSCSKTLLFWQFVGESEQSKSPTMPSKSLFYGATECGLSKLWLAKNWAPFSGR
jgi:hypothetical protein